MVDLCQWAISAYMQGDDMLGVMNKVDAVRIWCIRWLYLAAIGHFVVGLLMAWWGDSVLFSHYNQIALENFILIDNSSAKELHIWWLAIFGATLQAFSILLAALVYLGSQYKDNRVWLLIIIAIVIWAPQDIYFSAMKDIWMNVWVDLAAVVTLLPPLVFLMRCDRKIL
jgi:hypothetical protein